MTFGGDSSPEKNSSSLIREIDIDLSRPLKTTKIPLTVKEMIQDNSINESVDAI